MLQRLARLALVPAFVLLALTSTAFAQIDTGVIVGRVVDDSGAVLPGVSVDRHAGGDRRRRDAVTNANGEFIFPGLRVGSYSVAAELQGFKRAVRHEVRVNVQTRAQVDLQLSVGTLSEEVTVVGKTELLQTQTADIGSVIDARQVQDLPLLRTTVFGAGVFVAWRGGGAGGHHEPRRRHLLQRQRQLRDVEQLHARRRRQQLVLDQPAGTQPAGGAAAGRRAVGVQGADAHLLGGIRQGRRSGDQRIGEAGQQQASADRCSASCATKR